MKTFGLRAAIIGMGSIGPVHIDAIRRLGAQVVALVGSSLERARAQADQFGVPSAYCDYRVVLDRQDVDVVHICTPNYLHFSMARDALAAGKHVICEKPLARDSAESAILLESALGSRLVHAVNFNNRFYPLVQQAHELVHAGELGQPISIRGSCLMDSLLFETDYNWRLDRELGGATCVLSTVGSHLVDLLAFVAGQSIVEVCADLSTVHTVRRPLPNTLQTDAAPDVATERVERVVQSEDYADALLRFGSGARGHLTVSQVSAGRKYSYRIEVDGTKAALLWESEEPNRLWLGYRDQANRVLMKDPSLLSSAAARLADQPGGCAEGFAETFKQFVGSVYGAIGNGARGSSEFPTFADGHAERLVNDAIAKSGSTGKWVRVAKHRE